MTNVVAKVEVKKVVLGVHSILNKGEMRLLVSLRKCIFVF